MEKLSSGELPVMDSADYRKKTDNLFMVDLLWKMRGEVKGGAGDLFLEQIKLLEVEYQRAQTLKAVEQATGISFKVVHSEGGQELAKQGVAAFVDTETGVPYISDQTLDNLYLARHAGLHEKEHVKSGIYQLGLSGFMNPKEIEFLEKELQVSGLENINLVEGFTEFSTRNINSNPVQTAYTDHEVPVAEKLEKLAQEHLNISLLETFRSGNAEELKNQLKRLHDALKIKEIRTQLGLNNPQKSLN